MKKEYIEHSMFLCNYGSIKEFSLLFNADIHKKQNWSIVCERKEDLITIRNQIFYELQKSDTTKKYSNSIYGISMYTLDNLARNFCASLSTVTNKKIRNEIPSNIFHPYIDVINQEKLIEYTLKSFNYFNNDALPIAKQLLSLIDIEWPENLSFVNLLIETQNKEQNNNIQEINEISLKQILATYQFAKDELQNYSRLQSLVRDYLNKMYIDHLVEDPKNLVLPSNFISGNILWISAPEYLNNLNNIDDIQNNKTQLFNTIKPGNFQSYIVDEFKQSIEKSRSILNCKNTFFWENRTVIKESYSDFSIDTKHISYIVATNNHCFLEKVENEIKNKFSLLADFDPSLLKLSLPDASGKYEISENLIENWNKNDLNYYMHDQIYPQLDNYFDEFTQYLSFVSNKDKINKIAKIYSIQNNLNNEFYEVLLKSFLQQQTVQIGNILEISQLPKALSFFNSIDLPKEIISIGRAHAPTKSTFTVKVLNIAIAMLRKNGVQIDLPASEIMYKGFWKNLCNLNIPLTFILNHSSEIENFPEYLIANNNVKYFGASFNFNFNSKIKDEINKFPDSFSNWQSYLIQHKNKISITNFEKYINCPLNFYLQEVLKLKKENSDYFKYDAMQVGSKMHFICEQLIARLVTTLGNQNYHKIMANIYHDMITVLQNEHIFLAAKKKDWIKEFEKIIHEKGFIFSNEIMLAFEEALNSIWETDNLEFKKLHEREILKRSFLRFLILENKNSIEQPESYVGIERERPIQLKLAGLEFSGKIDRIDCNHLGIQIIDYKTSNIPKTEKKLVILPSELQKTGNKSAKLSVQGALYCLAWAHNHLLADEEDVSRSQIQSFSLSHLKNLDLEQNPILRYEFNPPLKKESAFYLEIFNEYSEYAVKLKEGKFSPDPLKLTNCNFCDFKYICPLQISTQQNDDMQNELTT